jgi:hypothetical protein
MLVAINFASKPSVLLVSICPVLGIFILYTSILVKSKTEGVS